MTYTTKEEAKGALRAIQLILGVTPDGDPRKATIAKLEELRQFAWTPWGTNAGFSAGATTGATTNSEWHDVYASSFADSADIAAFRRCKAQGNSDEYCFAKGDNGIGAWGDDTTVNLPMCALPRDIWKDKFEPDNLARGAKVKVRANGREIICELRDTMPWLRNIKNGAGIDLNPAAVKALGLNPPIKVKAQWAWA